MPETDGTPLVVGTPAEEGGGKAIEVELAQVSTRYERFRNSDVLSATFAGHLAHTGMTVGEPTPGIYLDSSDIGEVSAGVPAIHPFVAILGPDDCAARRPRDCDPGTAAPRDEPRFSLSGGRARYGAEGRGPPSPPPWWLRQGSGARGWCR